MAVLGPKIHHEGYEGWIDATWISVFGDELGGLGADRIDILAMQLRFSRFRQCLNLASEMHHSDGDADAGSAKSMAVTFSLSCCWNMSKLKAGRAAFVWCFAIGYLAGPTHLPEFLTWCKQAVRLWALWGNHIFRAVPAKCLLGFHWLKLQCVFEPPAQISVKLRKNLRPNLPVFLWMLSLKVCVCVCGKAALFDCLTAGLIISQQHEPTQNKCHKNWLRCKIFVISAEHLYLLNVENTAPFLCRFNSTPYLTMLTMAMTSELAVGPPHRSLASGTACVDWN